MQVMTLEGEHVIISSSQPIAKHSLEGGVKGWVREGPQYTRLMDGFDEKYWQELFAQEAGATGAGTAGGEEKKLAGEGDVKQ